MVTPAEIEGITVNARGKSPLPAGTLTGLIPPEASTEAVYRTVAPDAGSAATNPKTATSVRATIARRCCDVTGGMVLSPRGVSKLQEERPRVPLPQVNALQDE